LIGNEDFTPQVHSVLYPPVHPQEATPRRISGRTSYLQVRLAYYL